MNSEALGNMITQIPAYFSSLSFQQPFVTQDIPYLSIRDLNRLRTVNKECYRIYALAFNVMKVLVLYQYDDLTSFCDLKTRVFPSERLADWYRRVACVIVQRTPLVHQLNINRLKGVIPFTFLIF